MLALINCGTDKRKKELENVELMNITGEAILEKIGRFPEEDRHCAFLAAETLQEALNQYMLARQENQ